MEEDTLAEMEEAYSVAEAMIKYGGSFVKALGEALMHADIFNTRKIKAAFLELWKEYTKAAMYMSEW